MSDDIVDDPFAGKFRVPNLEDKLFIHADDWWMNACLNWHHDPTELYISGYKEAADRLVECVADRNGSADSLIFPIVFLYRQYLELRLKSLLKTGRRLLDKPHNEKSEHRLSRIWPEVKQMLIEIFPSGDIKDLKALDSLIAQFEQVDPGSTTFRYPKDFDGRNSLKLEIPTVNLRNLAEVIGAMAIILDGSADGIGEYQGYKSDMQSGW